MVAGNHDGTDTGLFGVSHSLDALRPGRVNHGDEAHEGVVGLVFQGEQTGFLHGTQGEGQHPQTIFRLLAVDLLDLGAELGSHGDRAVGGEQPDGAVQQHIDGALGVQGGTVVGVVQGAHQLAVGVKGQLGQTGVLGAVGTLLYTEASAQLNQGYLGGIAHGGAGLVVHGGVAVQQSDFQQGALGIVGQLQVGATGDDAVGPDVLDRHAILSKGTGLIGADDLNGAQALHRFQLLDNGVLTGHLLGAHSQHDSDNGAESLRDGGNGQSHGKHEGVQNGHVAAEDRQEEDAGADDHDDHGQLAGEVIQVLLQRSLALLSLIHQGGDASQLGVHAGGGNHHDGTAVGD